MSKSYNKTIIIGRLGANPIEKNGCAVFPILNTTWDVKIHKEQVQMHKAYAVGKQAALVMKHLHKGDLCCIEGKLDEKQSICAERITFLSNRRKENEKSR